MSCVKNLVKFLLVCLSVVVVLGTNMSYANKPVYNSNKNMKEKIAITFDDGPHPIRSLKLLDILKKHEVKATFFVIGENVKNYPQAFLKIVSDGHEIANHTYTHKILKNGTYFSVKKEINDTENEVKNCGGKIEKMIRPPCGIFDNNLLKLANKEEYKIVLWNIDTHDWANEETDKIVTNIINNVSGGDIILFHDYTSGKNYTGEALDKVIPLLKEKGFELVTVSQLLQE